MRPSGHSVTGRLIRLGCCPINTAAEDASQTRACSAVSSFLQVVPCRFNRAGQPVAAIQAVRRSAGTPSFLKSRKSTVQPASVNAARICLTESQLVIPQRMTVELKRVLPFDDEGLLSVPPTPPRCVPALATHRWSNPAVPARRSGGLRPGARDEPDEAPRYPRPARCPAPPAADAHRC
jgi:hypothetical protein